jgi:hypothetical protein
MVLNASFNNISVISWRSGLLVEETGVTVEKQRPVPSRYLLFCLFHFLSILKMCFGVRVHITFVHVISACIRYRCELKCRPCIEMCKNISVISWRSGLLVKETGVPWENHQHVSHWQTNNVVWVLNTPRQSECCLSEECITYTMVRTSFFMMMMMIIIMSVLYYSSWR